MYGFKIDLLMDTRENCNAVNNDIRSNVSNLIWSSYDRINIKKVENFEDFFLFDDSTIKWTGSMQSLHLFTTEFSKSHSISVRDNDTSNKTNCLMFDANDPDNEYSLSMIVSVKINEKIFYKNNIKQNKYLVESIQNIINLTSQKKCIAECFFSLGEEDIVIIALGNSVDKFMEIIKSIRSLYFKDGNTKQKVCNLTNSFLIQNCIEYATEIECENSYANLYITLKNGINENIFVTNFLQKSSEILEKKDIEKLDISEIATMMVGEYDVLIKLTTSTFGKNLFDLYSEKDSTRPLNANSKFYEQYINASKTIWCYKLKKGSENVANNNTNYEIKFNNLNQEYPFNNQESDVDCLVKELLAYLNSEVKSKDKSIQYAYHNVIYFLKDAISTLHSTTNKQWKYIISEQIMTFVQLYNNFSQRFNNTENFDTFVMDLNEVINDMRNSLSNINRSHELFYHIPASSLNYSGSFNAILLAYYNFIDKLLNVAFKKPHNKTNQAKIVFFVYFGMTSKIQQKTYFKDSLDPDSTKLVGFELPYTALYDLEKYFISLTHEVYHLIAPYDRKRRNKMVLILWNEILVKKQLLSIINKELNFTEENNDYYRILVILINEFFKKNGIIFNIDNYDLLSVKVLNRKLADFSNNYEASQKLETLYCNFKVFCSVRRKEIIQKEEINLEEREKQILEICEKIEKLITNFQNCKKNFAFDKDSILNVQTLVDNIAESICDTFMYQLSFSMSDNPNQHFINYIIDFFDEKNINYSENLDASYRLFLFMLYNELNEDGGINLTKFETNKCVYEKLQRIFKTYFDYYGPAILELVKNIINEDNFLYSLQYCYSDKKFEEILTEEENIKSSFILPLSHDKSKFSKYINVIYTLNSEFKIPEYRYIDSEKNYNDITFPEYITKSMSTQTIPTRYVRTLDEFLLIIHENSKVNPKDEIWYRGVCNYSYHLIPSIYVHLPKNKNIIPYLFQIKYLRHCYVKTKKYFNAFAQHEQPYAARQSLMQHYGVPTNLLDFSTDPIAALYWALNPEADYDQNKSTTAVVYFFNPRKYYNVCKYIKENYSPEACGYHKHFGIYKGIYSHNCLDDEYIIEKTTDELISKKVETFVREANNQNESDIFKRLPLPVVIPQENIRISAQSGTFVAFNLLSIPKNNDYNYLALDNIQNEYIKLRKQNNLPYQQDIFLERVLINPSDIDELKMHMMNTFKYSKENIYPDLEFLFQDIKDTIKKAEQLDN